MGGMQRGRVVEVDPAWFRASPRRHRSPFHGEYGFSRASLTLFVAALLVVGSILGTWPYCLARANSMTLVRQGNRTFLVPDEHVSKFRSADAHGDAGRPSPQQQAASNVD